jgi:putative DNA primase/helicase
LLKEFPFDDSASKSVAIASILTVLVRDSLTSAPLFAYSAPTPGSGKSALADVAAILATGEPSAVLSQGPNEEEMEKRLGAGLLNGDKIVNIDNVERPLKGQTLCQMLTQQKLRIRILGKSKNQEIPSRATVFSTGNNLSLHGDLTRRSLMCKLDVGMERPEERIFKRNIYQYVKENRAEFVHAALTILKAYHVAKKPDQNLTPWGSFEDWSGWIRSSLV